LLASPQDVDEEDGDCDEDGEEVRDMREVSEENAGGCDGEGLPEEVLVCGDGVGFDVTLVGVIGALEEGACEEAPGEEPDDVESPEEVAGKLVVVPGESLAEEAEEVFVDEVEPEEAVAVHASGVAEAGEDVPGRGDDEEEEQAGEGFEGAPLLVLAGEGEIDEACPAKEDQGYEAFGEDGEREGGPHEVGIRGGRERAALCAQAGGIGGRGIQCA
jgi:hypothetical protein